MKILVVSDTHGSVMAVKKVKPFLKNVDVLIHLGDDSHDINALIDDFTGKVYTIRGNCDLVGDNPKSRVEIIGGKKFYMTHGHENNVNYGLTNLMYKGLEAEADVILYGHTHISNIENEGNIWIINPGSAAKPRAGKPSVAEIVVQGDEIIASIINI